MLQIAIADDHAMFVDGIESILRNENTIQVVARCFDGNSVFEMLRKYPVDVLLLDINLPDLSGIEVSKRIHEDFPDVKVIALSMYNEESIVSEMLKNGARGYILKNTGHHELIQAIQAVAAGHTYFSKDVTETIMGSLAKKPGTKKSFVLVPKLSNREKQILALIVKEYTTPEIAERLFISLKTVETHRSNLISKLNVRNTAGLVRAAIELQLIDKSVID
ncbi:MAG: response regulator transcription factor [Saprospiraceae bacterium]|jgi:DNA-binding NarL/FixJ family response regulator|nr:response regulator transcription factor [Saprospiraceae bacterium]MBP9209644.1 response regulator transcription factor [Saprospiraceae bacterium]